MTQQQTLHQERAASAWAQIEQVDQSTNDKFKKEYGSLVRGLPSMILSDGLGQSLAFLLAKAGNDHSDRHYLAFDHLSRWVCGQLKAPKNKNLLDWVLEQTTGNYRRATSEALAYLNWMKRFVEAKGWQSEEKD